jgi:hypothetical protein
VFAVSKRPIKPIMAPDLTALAPVTGVPRFKIVDPKTLLVDDAYQRALSERSVVLIRKMVSQWDWRKFKPPIVAETDAGDEVIDGQHTAIGAASNPFITEIPVMVVEAAEQGDRAAAFVGHNRDRINLTQMQMHYAAVAAGEEDALTVQQVCDRAGVRILRVPSANYKPGDTLAVMAIKALCNRRGALGARVVLEVLANAQAAPLAAGSIKAVETLLHDPEYKGQVAAADITTAILAKGAELEKEAAVFAAAHNILLWKALTAVLFKEVRRGRRRAA